MANEHSQLRLLANITWIAVGSLVGSIANAQQPTASEAFHLRSECAALGEKMLEKLKKENHPNGPLYEPYNQISHYDPQTNRCYVDTLAMDDRTKNGLGIVAFNESLYDGQSGQLLYHTLYHSKFKKDGLEQYPKYDVAHEAINKLMGEDKRK